MKTIYIAKAEITCKHIESICIEIFNEIPKLSLDQMKHFYNREAESLYLNLITTLPQATVDRLLIKLLEQNASLLKIALKET